MGRLRESGESAEQLGTTHTFKLQNKEKKYSETVPSKVLTFSDQLEKQTHVSKDALICWPVLPVCSIRIQTGAGLSPGHYHREFSQHPEGWGCESSPCSP